MRKPQYERGERADRDPGKSQMKGESQMKDVMRIAASWLTVILIGLAPAGAASAQTRPLDGAGLSNLTERYAGQPRRIALIIGNGDYQHNKSMSKLPNPARDARLMQQTLQEVGFEVQYYDDATLVDMRVAIDEFIEELEREVNTVALFYYAGHGVQADGVNYLIPIDANIRKPRMLRYAGISVQDFLNQLEKTRVRMSVVILDACRNNPYGRASRTARGLLRVEKSALPRGSLIAYSTNPGNVAADGKGKNSPYNVGLGRAYPNARPRDPENVQPSGEAGSGAGSRPNSLDQLLVD